jgi:hypothetical protein
MTSANDKDRPALALRPLQIQRQSPWRAWRLHGVAIRLAELVYLIASASGWPCAPEGWVSPSAAARVGARSIVWQGVV